jgi:Uma2 family endonuclease
MSAMLTAPPPTADDLLEMPNDGIDRWLVRGELREKPMTVRNRFHSRINIRLGQLLSNWVDQQPAPRGQVLGGEAGVRLRRDPETTVGIDLVYISADLVARQGDDTKLVDGVPELAVEILSPNDTVEEIDEKVGVYQECGVPLVWIVHPRTRTVLVHRLDAEPQLYTIAQEISNERHLPGLHLSVARIFE